MANIPVHSWVDQRRTIPTVLILMLVCAFEHSGELVTVIIKPCPDGVKKDGHFHFAPLNLQVVQEEKWARHGNMQNVVLVWIAQSNFYYTMPP